MTGVPDDLAAGCRRAQILAAQMVLTVPIYAYVLEIVRRVHGTAGFAPGAPLGALRIGLAALAVIDLAAIPILTSTVLASPQRGVRDTVSFRTRLLLTASIIAMALSEAVALLGLALSLLGGRASDYYPFAVVSLAALAWHFPRRSAWEARLREMPTT